MNYKILRENWLSPSYLGGYRSVGRLEKEGSLRPDRMIYGRPTWEGQPRRSSSYEDKRPVTCCKSRKRQFEPLPETHQHNQTQFSKLKLIKKKM